MSQPTKTSSEIKTESAAKYLENLRKQYAASMEIWMSTYQSWQKAGEDAFKLSTKVVEFAIKSSNLDGTKKFNDLWEKTTKNIQANPYSWYLKAWDDMWKESSFVNFEAFQNYWQDMWKNFTPDTSKKSGSEKTNEVKKEG